MYFTGEHQLASGHDCQMGSYAIELIIGMRVSSHFKRNSKHRAIQIAGPLVSSDVFPALLCHPLLASVVARSGITGQWAIWDMDEQQ